SFCLLNLEAVYGPPNGRKRRTLRDFITRCGAGLIPYPLGTLYEPCPDSVSLRCNSIARLRIVLSVPCFCGGPPTPPPRHPFPQPDSTGYAGGNDSARRKRMATSKLSSRRRR